MFEVLGKIYNPLENEENFDSPDEFYVQPINGDPFVAMLETPVTSDEAVVWFLSNLPAYKTAVSPVTRGVEIGLAHGYWISGPWIKVGPFRSLEYPLPEVVGCISGLGACCLLFFAMIIYGRIQFTNNDFILPAGVGTKTLSGRPITPDPAFTTPEGWNKLTAGVMVGSLAGVAWCYIMCTTLPFYHLPGYY